jgi:hypothetical protein
MNGKTIFFLALASLVLVGCGSVSATTFNLTYTDGLVAYWDMNSTVDSYTGTFNLTKTPWTGGGSGVTNFTTSGAIYGMSSYHLGGTGSSSYSGTQFNITNTTGNQLPCITANCTGATINFWVINQKCSARTWFIDNNGPYPYIQTGWFTEYTTSFQSTGIYDGLSCKENTTFMVTMSLNLTGLTEYINGVKKGTDARTGEKFLNRISVGGRQGGLYALKGYIDELAIWNKSLSAAEVSTLYSGGAGGSGYFYEGPAAPADTCTAPASGNWAITCSDNCTWSTNQVVPANITMTGSGFTRLLANWTFTGSSQYINIGSGCQFGFSGTSFR